MTIEFEHYDPHSKKWVSKVYEAMSVTALKQTFRHDMNEYKINSVIDNGIKFSVGQTVYRHFTDPMSLPRKTEAVIKSLEGEAGLYDAIVIDKATDTMLYVNFIDLTLS